MRNEVINIQEICRLLHKEHPYNSLWTWRRKLDMISLGVDLFTKEERSHYLIVVDNAVKNQLKKLKPWQSK